MLIVLQSGQRCELARARFHFPFKGSTRRLLPFGYPIDGLLIVLQSKMSFSQGGVVPPLIGDPLVTGIANHRTHLIHDILSNSLSPRAALLSSLRRLASLFRFSFFKARQLIKNKSGVDAGVTLIVCHTLFIAAQVIKQRTLEILPLVIYFPFALKD